MTHLSAFVRTAPKLFFVVAALDFLKNTVPLARLYTEGTFLGINYDAPVRLQIFGVILSALVYAAGWIAYGVVTSILIALYDEVVALRATAEEARNA